MPTNPSYDRTIVLNMLYAACALIVLGAIVGIAGSKIVDAATGATLGTAVLGAGAALLPTGALGARAGSNAAAGQPPASQPSPATPGAVPHA